MSELPDPARDDIEISEQEQDDLPVTPPTQNPRLPERDPAQEETIEDRIRQEEPDPNSAYGAPGNESGLDTDMAGGSDPDAIAAGRDSVGQLTGEVADEEFEDGGEKLG